MTALPVIRFATISFGASSYTLTDADIAGYYKVILNWDTLTSGRIDPISKSTEPAEAQFTADNTVSIGTYSNLANLLTASDINGAAHFIKAEVEIKESHNADGSGAVTIFKGHVDDLRAISQGKLSVLCVGFDVGLSLKFDCSYLDTDTYPNADRNDVGKMLPIAYGEVQQVPFLGADVGATSTLVGAISATDTSIEITDASRFSSSGTIIIGGEEIVYTSISGNVITATTRGANDTEATNHVDGALVIEKITDYVYIIGHAVNSIQNVYLGGRRLDPDGPDSATGAQYTAYTGGSGDYYSEDYEGLACIVLHAPPVRILQSFPALSYSYSPLSSSVAKRPDGPLANDDADDWSQIYDGNESTYNNDSYAACTGGDALGVYFTDPDYPPTKVIIKQTFHILCDTSFDSSPDTTVKIYIHEGQSDTEDPCSVIETVIGTIDPSGGKAWFTVETTDSRWKAGIVIMVDTGKKIHVYDIYKEVTYSEEAEAFTTVALGTSSGKAKFRLDQVTADLKGYELSGSFAEYPDEIMKHILTIKCGLSSSVISNSYTTAHTHYVSEGYKLAFCLLEPPVVRELLNHCAVQAHSLEYWEAGKHYLKYIDDSSVARDHTYTADNIYMDSIQIELTSKNDLINTIVATFVKRWNQIPEGDVVASSNTVEATDATSVTAYGELQGDPQDFPYVTDPTQAQDLVNWIVRDQKDVRRVISFMLSPGVEEVSLLDIIGFSFTAGSTLYLSLGSIVNTTDDFRVIEVDKTDPSGVQVTAIEIL